MSPSGPVLAGVFSSRSMGKLVANASLDLDPESQLHLERLHESPVRGARLQLLSAVSSVFLSNPHTEHLAHPVYLAFTHPVSLPPWGGGPSSASPSPPRPRLPPQACSRALYMPLSCRWSSQSSFSMHLLLFFVLFVLFCLGTIRHGFECREVDSLSSALLCGSSGGVQGDPEQSHAKQFGPIVLINDAHGFAEVSI